MPVEGLPVEQKRLLLFLTRGMSLREWERLGLFERELALYRRLVDHGWEVGIVSYGGRDEQEYEQRLAGMSVFSNAAGLPLTVYERIIPWLHGRRLRHYSVLKTNQALGGEAARITARVLKKPLVARCGFLWSWNTEKDGNSRAARRARHLEGRLFRAARRIVLTTPAMAEIVANQWPEVARQIRIIPNYVETDRFCPRPATEEADGEGMFDTDLLFVGRLSAEKNLFALLDAIHPLNIRLKVIGGGPLEAELRDHPASREGRVLWMGRIPHEELPKHFRSCRGFVLPSLYEGHPKALIEAMSCGCPVIGTDVPGIREVLEHRRTGLLCPTDAEGLRAAIQTLLQDPPLSANLGSAARSTAVERFALARIVEQEIDVLTEAICQ